MNKNNKKPLLTEEQMLNLLSIVDKKGNNEVIGKKQPAIMDTTNCVIKPFEFQDFSDVKNQ